MKSDTLEIMSQLEKIYKKNDKLFPSIRFTTEGTNMLKDLFRKIHTCNQEWSLQQKTIQINTLTELPKSPDYTYMPPQIRTEIDKKCNKRISCVFPFKNRTFTIYLCMDSTVQNDEIERRIKQIYLWLSLVNQYVKSSCSNTVNIYMYFIDLKKSLPHHHADPIDQVHVNTAFTTTCQPHTNVHIFREEEWYRALIHESFHNLGLDFILMNSKFNQIAENRIRAIFPITIKELRFYETYCEMWGEIMNCMFMVYQFESLSGKTLPITRCITALKEMLQYERIFSLFQCVKVLRHNKMTYNQIQNSYSAAKYKEKTQGFSYYILKSIFMVHVSQFLDFCATQSGSYSLQFRLNMKSLNRYTQIIENNYDSQQMKDGIQLMEKEISDAQGIMKKTLRMSLFEI